MFCAIWYYLYNLKSVKNTHGGVLLVVKLQAKLYKWYQIAKRITCFCFIMANTYIWTNNYPGKQTDSPIPKPLQSQANFLKQ